MKKKQQRNACRGDAYKSPRLAQQKRDVDRYEANFRGNCKTGLVIAGLCIKHAPMNPIRWPLHWQILVSLILAAAVGLPLNIRGHDETPLALQLVAICDFIGTLFMNALKMVVVPLVASSIISGIIGMGSEKGFARMGLKTMLYYFASGLVAVLIGLACVNLIRPGVVAPDVAAEIVGQAEGAKELAARAEGRGTGDLVDIFIRMLPPNIFEAATDNGQLLGLITFSLLFGFFAAKLPDGMRGFQSNFWNSTQTVMMGITNLVIRFAPIGVFGLVTPLLIRTGFGLLQPLLWFVLTVLLALALHFFIALGLALKYFGRIRPSLHYKAMMPVLLTAFSTASSASTLPVTLETVEEKAKVSNRVSSFTLPLGATVNMDGTALYECVVVIFLAQIYGVLEGFELGLIMQFNIVVLALLTSIGVAGIPAASLVAITMILIAVGLPPEAIGIVWVADRVLDMCRTAVNVFSDTVGAVIIARSEGEDVYPNAKQPEAVIPTV